MAESEPNLEPLKLPTERPPFAGFLFRLLAFVLDCVLLYFIFKGLDAIARPALLTLNPALPWLCHLVVFLYFWLCAGPLTKGQTAAQALLNIRVVGRDGNPLGWAAATRRALIQQGVFALFLMRGIPENIIIFPTGMEYGLSIVLLSLSTLGFTLLVILGLGTLFHPYKQGWHDLWAGSYVTSSPVPFAFRTALETPPDVVTQRKLASHFKITFIFWVVISGLFLFQLLRGMNAPEARALTREQAALRQQYSTPAYEFITMIFPSLEIQQSFATQVRWEQERAKSAGQTVPTTETLSRQWMQDASTISAAYFKRHGAYAHGDLDAPALRASIDRLRADAWKKWQQNPDRASVATSGTLHAKTFNALLFEPLAMMLYNGRQLRGRVHGPADPAQGSLIFEDVLSPLPEAVDQKTTASASSEALRTHETPRP